LAGSLVQNSKGFRWDGPTTHGQTTVKNAVRRVVGVRRRAADLRFRGADDGNRTRVFSLGSMRQSLLVTDVDGVRPAGDVPPLVTGQCRSGDVRHIVASPERAVELLGFRAVIDPRDSLREFPTRRREANRRFLNSSERAVLAFAGLGDSHHCVYRSGTFLGGPMAKHRKHSQLQSTVAKRGGTGFAAAALTVTGLSTAVVTGTTAAVAPNVQLMALVSAANSTSQFFAGSSYYGTDWTDVYGDQEVVPFLLGPQGLANAISAHQDDGDDEPTGVTASGWGAGQTGTALGILANNGDADDLDNVGLVILDNNSNRAGGGFWTTYAVFAPLLLTSAEPTPNDTGVPILDVAYEYNINSDAPVDPLNPFALGNSLAAYVYGYGAEQTTTIPTTYIDENNEVTQLKPGFHYVVENGVVVDYYPAPGPSENPNTSTIFVTVRSDELPLTRPLRLIPGGDILANALDPTMTALVNAGYADGKGTEDNPAIPLDPGVTRPMQPGSSLENLGGVPGTLQTGLDAGVDTAQHDLESPTNFVTKPLGEVGRLPVLGSLVNLPTTNSATTRLSSNSPNLFRPGGNNNGAAGSAGSTGRENPLKTFKSRVDQAVDRVTGGLQGGKPADTKPTGDNAQ
jgi:hypothetical protein